MLIGVLMSYFRKVAAGLTGACVLAVAAGASAAVPVVGAVRIEITSALPDYLQIFDVQALELGALDNVASAAEGASVSAVSSGFATSPDGAIDEFASTYYHSGGASGSEKLTIQLARTATLSSLSITGRTFCCRDRDFWNVSIFGAADALLFSGQFDARQTPDSIARVDFDAPVGGVPEPATWAMMILGFGAAGAAIRRRRPAVA
jgi:PEP-CTERM motif